MWTVGDVRAAQRVGRLAPLGPSPRVSAWDTLTRLCGALFLRVVLTHS